MAQAMIFAAGLGTRLRPITNNIPKALVEVGGQTLLEHAIKHLKYYNFENIVVNVHHFAEKVISKCKELEKKYNVTIEISDETDCLLETGGGLKKALKYFTNESYIIAYNVDILSNLNLKKLVEYHKERNAIATLSVRSRKTNRYFLFNEKMELCGWKNMQNNEIRLSCQNIIKLKPFAFSGIQVIDDEMFKLLKLWEGSFSITEVYINLCAYYRIIGLFEDNSFWMDIGTYEKLEEAKSLINNLKL